MKKLFISLTFCSALALMPTASFADCCLVRYEWNARTNTFSITTSGQPYRLHRSTSTCEPGNCLSLRACCTPGGSATE